MLLKDLFQLDSYQSFFEKGSWFNLSENLQSVLNALINIVYGLIKYLVLALDYIIEKLFNLNLLSGVLPTLFSTAKSIYTKLFSLLGILLFTFVIIFVVRDFFEKGITKALIRCLMFFLIYFSALLFFQDGATKLQDINTLSKDVQGQLVDLTSTNIDQLNGSNSEKLLGSTDQLDGTTKIRNVIFDEFVLKPYALLNYGKTNLSKAELQQYLVAKNERYDKEKVKKINAKIKTDSEKNAYLTSDRMTEKIAVLINTLVMVFVIGTAILLIGVANCLIQLLLYGLIFLMPSLLFLALVPNMHHLLKNGVLLFGTLFASKIGIGFGFGLLFAILHVIDTFFVVTNIVTMIVGLLVKLLLGMFIWKNKKMIFRALTKGQANLHVPAFPTKPHFPTYSSEKAETSIPPFHEATSTIQSSTSTKHQTSLSQIPETDDLYDNLLVQSSKAEQVTKSSEDIDTSNKEKAKVPDPESELTDPSISDNKFTEDSPLLTKEYSSDFSHDPNNDSSDPAFSNRSIPISQTESTPNLFISPKKIRTTSEKKDSIPRPLSRQEAESFEKELSNLRSESLNRNGETLNEKI